MFPVSNRSEWALPEYDLKSYLSKRYIDRKANAEGGRVRRQELRERDL